MLVYLHSPLYSANCLNIDIFKIINNKKLFTLMYSCRDGGMVKSNLIKKLSNAEDDIDIISIDSKVFRFLFFNLLRSKILFRYLLLYIL